MSDDSLTIQTFLECYDSYKQWENTPQSIYVADIENHYTKKPACYEEHKNKIKEIIGDDKYAVIERNYASFVAMLRKNEHTHTQITKELLDIIYTDILTEENTKKDQEERIANIQNGELGNEPLTIDIFLYCYDSYKKWETKTKPISAEDIDEHNTKKPACYEKFKNKIKEIIGDEKYAVIERNYTSFVAMLRKNEHTHTPITKELLDNIYAEIIKEETQRISNEKIDKYLNSGYGYLREIFMNIIVYYLFYYSLDKASITISGIRGIRDDEKPKFKDIGFEYSNNALTSNSDKPIKIQFDICFLSSSHQSIRLSDIIYRNMFVKYFKETSKSLLLQPRTTTERGSETKSRIGNRLTKFFSKLTTSPNQNNTAKFKNFVFIYIREYIDHIISDNYIPDVKDALLQKLEADCEKLFREFDMEKPFDICSFIESEIKELAKIIMNLTKTGGKRNRRRKTLKRTKRNMKSKRKSRVSKK